MKTIRQSSLRHIGLMSLLCVPLMILPTAAAELVGKPASISAQASSAAKTAAATSAANMTTSAAKSTPSLGTHMAPPAPPEEPAPPEPDFKGNGVPDDIQGAVDDFNNGLDDVFGHHQGEGSHFDPELLIPILAITLLFGGPVLVIIVLALLYYRSKARRQQNINANIDKLLAAGRDIPVELLLGEEAVVRTPSSNGTVSYASNDLMMQKGVRNIGLGAGWLLFLTIMFGIKIGSFGFIFIGLGISQVVIWKLSSPSVTISRETATREQE